LISGNFATCRYRHKKEIIDPIMTKYAIDHQEAAGTVLKGTAMPVVSVIVNNKILESNI
jgi:hypothetical protein